MSSGKYQVRQTSHGWLVYNMLDNETIARFRTELAAQQYANKLNGKE